MIEKVENSITKARFILRKFKSSLTVNARKILYYAFVESHLQYGISLWGMSKGRALTSLKLKHKSIIRTLEVGKFHTEPILKRNKLLKIEDIYKLEMSKLAWQFNKHRLPEAVTELIEYRNIARELREVSKVIVPRTRNESDKCQFDISICRYINNLDQRLINNNSKTGINLKLKMGLLTRYQEVVTCNSPRCCECTLLPNY